MRAGGRAAVAGAVLAGIAGLVLPSASTVAAAGPAAVAAPTQSSPPTLPPGSNELLEVLSPTLSTLCGYVQTAASLVPVAQGLLGVELPPEVLQTLRPVYELCAAVPVPLLRRSCVLETDVFLTLSPVVESLTGLPLPIQPTAISLLADQLVALDRLLPTLGSTLAATLDAVGQCTVGEAPTTTTTTTAPPTTTTVATAADRPSSGAPLASTRPAGAARSTPSPVAPSPAPVAAEVAASTEMIPSARVVPSTFKYRIVFLAPLVLLGVGGAIARSLAAPVTGSAGGPRRTRKGAP